MVLGLFIHLSRSRASACENLQKGELTLQTAFTLSQRAAEMNVSRFKNIYCKFTAFTINTMLSVLYCISDGAV